MVPYDLVGLHEVILSRWNRLVGGIYSRTDHNRWMTLHLAPNKLHSNAGLRLC